STTELRITNSNSASGYGNSSNNLLAYSTPQLVSGATDVESATITVPSTLTPGTYYVWAIADNLTTANQGSNTGNDFAVSGSFTVTAPVSNSDLVPQSVTLGSSSVTAGGSLGVSWLIHINGPGTATASTTELR